jgi:FdhD protein
MSSRSSRPASAALRPDDHAFARAVVVRRVGPEGDATGDDPVARESPLEIRVNGVSLAVVMRTPGHDLDLVRGLLLAEGIVSDAGEVASVVHCRTAPPSAPDEARDNVVLVRLRPGVELDPARHRRAFVANSSCGVCGRATIDELARRAPAVLSDLVVTAPLLLSLPALLRSRQRGFDVTGGVHAAALFAVRDGTAVPIVVREDVGRHNAVDKVVGAAMRGGLLPLSRCVLLVSGRASFEIVQKARVAGVPVVAAVSAPTSLAVELAQAGGQTLVAFVREQRLNVYSAPERVLAATARARAEVGAGTPATTAPPRSTGRRRRSGSRGRRAAA